MKDPLTDEHTLYRLAIADISVCRHWDGHILMGLQLAIHICGDIHRQ
jgi:hypothetical protein